METVSVAILWDGLKLMICGMGVVFVFLVVMIIMMNLLRVALAPFAKASAPAAPAAPKSDDLTLIAAAVAAVDLERK